MYRNIYDTEGNTLGVDRRYLCLASDDHTPETMLELKIADSGECPFCGAEMTWEDYPE